MKLEIDDRVATPFGDADVVAIDHPSERVTVEYLDSGLSQQYNLEEFEAPDGPPLDDPEALSNWLDRRIQAVVIPSFRVEDDVWRCAEGEGCDCTHCYTIERRLTRIGSPAQTQYSHMTDNELCRCRPNGCGCV